jgi:hypothetical protein
MLARYGDPAQLAPTLLQQVPHQRRDGTIRYFCHWDPYHRYDGSRWDSETVAEAYLHEAESALAVITQMNIDGNLP